MKKGRSKNWRKREKDEERGLRGERIKGRNEGKRGGRKDGRRTKERKKSRKEGKRQKEVKN